MKVDMVTQKSGKLKVSNCMKAAKKQVKSLKNELFHMIQLDSAQYTNSPGTIVV